MTATDAPALPADLLAHYGDIVAEEVERTLGGDAPSPLTALVADYPSRAGKRLRPALLLATCEAFGGDLRDALPAAVSLELMHNAFLVHDDIEDASGRRRGARRHCTCNTAFPWRCTPVTRWPFEPCCHFWTSRDSAATSCSA